MKKNNMPEKKAETEPSPFSQIKEYLSRVVSFFISKREERRKRLESGKISITGGVIVIVILSLILFILATRYLVGNGYMTLPDTLGSLFGANVRDERNSEVPETAIVFEDNVLHSDTIYVPVIYENPDESMENILSSILNTGYDKSYRVSYAKTTEDGKSETITVLRSGDRFRIQTPTRTVICDGKDVYVKTKISTVVYPYTDSKVITDECGIPIIEYIMSADIETGDSSMFDDDNKTIEVTYTDGNADIKHTVVLNCENGSLVSERCTYKDTFYYSINIRSTDFSPVFDKDVFTLPEN